MQQFAFDPSRTNLGVRRQKSGIVSSYYSLEYLKPLSNFLMLGIEELIEDTVLKEPYNNLIATTLPMLSP
jgi:hypothetical protein